jgi:3-hydroxyacyl-[acyl-carrier-protein] dehydratase
MPLSLVIEGVAQTGGILVGESRDFKEKVVLAKVKRAGFDGMVLPGSQLRYDVRMDSISNEAAQVTGTVFCDGERFGEVEIMFSHADQNMSGLNLPAENFVFTEEFIALLGTYQAKGDRQAERDGALPAE